MDTKIKISLLLILTFFINLRAFTNDWLSIEKNAYKIYYTPQDSENIKEYVLMIDKGIETTEIFFGTSFKNKFEIYVHPNRESLDKQWQIDWQMPGFNSECWMVASGVSNRMDLLSPSVWKEMACEHNFSNIIETQNLITHELVHIFHGQWNASPNFDNTNGIDWFIEGLATFVSGQCDSIRIYDVKTASVDKEIPESLNKFWSGNLRYGLSGTLVMYINYKYGNKKIIELLEFNDLKDILKVLKISESQLISEWKLYVNNL